MEADCPAPSRASTPRRRPAALWRARLIGATLIALAAAHHGRLAILGVGDVARHEVFVGLDLALATLVAVKPRWAIAPIALLSVQQSWSHGSDLVDSLRGPGPFDVVSALVIVFFPALLALLLATTGLLSRPRTARGPRS